MIVLGIDVGTTGTKTIAVDETKGVIGRGYYEYGLDSRMGGIVEQDAEEWWKGTLNSLREAIADIPDKSQIRGISLSTQGASMTAVDAGGRVMYPAITWMDRRAVDQRDRLCSAVGENEMYRKCGWRCSPSVDIPKIMWLHDHEPAIFQTADAFLSTIDFINMRLTGRKVIDPTNAAIRGMFNINTMSWDSEVLTAAECPEVKLPEVLPAGEEVGTLTADAAVLLGLDPSVRVFNGAHDQYCAAIGSGALESGDMLLSCGTTWVILGVTDRPVYTDTYISPGKHPCGTAYGAMASLSSAGSALKWLREVIGEVPYPEIDRMAESRRENCADLFCMPYLAGSGFPHQEPRLAGGFIGMRLNHDKYDLARALMEGVAFETRCVLEEYKRNGIDISRLKMIGGAAKSTLWSGLTADITGCELTLMKESEGCALGAALIAAVGCGMFGSYREAADALIGGRTVRMPDPETRSFYEEKYQKYSALTGAIKGVVTQWQK